jgi:hypothetical protein
MAGVGTKIFAADYNAIQTLAQNVLGVGSGQFGYGQTVTSSQVQPGDPFFLNDWLNLRTDLLKIGAHQTGNVNESDELIIPGNLDPRNIINFISKTGSGPFLVTFSFEAIPTRPSVGAPYKIQGCTVESYNGVYICRASDTISITLEYPSDPGVFPSSTQGAGDNPFDLIGSVKVSSVLTDALRAQYLEYAQEKYINAYAPTVVITGATSTSTTMLAANAAIIMVGAVITGPGIQANTTISAVKPGESLTLSQSTTSSTTAAYTIALQTGIKTVAANQLTPNELITTVQRTQAWNGTVQTTATYTFATQDSVRAFFNSGSQLEIGSVLSGSFSSGSTLKDNTWKLMFEQIGIIAIRANDTIQVVAGNPDLSPTPSIHYPIGWFQLTETDRLIFQKNAPSGAYSANTLNVFARRPAGGTSLIVTIRFEDNAGAVPPYGTDEVVDGILTVNFTATRASGANVSVVSPALSVTPIA